MSALQIMAVAIGGAAGAVGRFAVSHTVAQNIGTSFPWGTVIVNIAGAFILGFLVEAATWVTIPPVIRSAVGVGFLGAFTTFSTFAVESLTLFRGQRWVQGFAYLGMNLGIGIAAAVAGVLAARELFQLIRG